VRLGLEDWFNHQAGHRNDYHYGEWLDAELSDCDSVTMAGVHVMGRIVCTLDGLNQRRRSPLSNPAEVLQIAAK